MHYRKAVSVVVFCFATLTAAVPTVAMADVTYELGPQTELVNEAFYTGQAEDGSSASGRMAYMASMSHDGRTIAFLGVNLATWQVALFLVDFGHPSSWRRLTSDIDAQGVAPITWTLDDATLICHESKVSLMNPVVEEFKPFGFTLHEPTMTSLPEANWLVSQYMHDGLHDIVAIPVLPNGEPDTSREPVAVTDWGVTGDWPIIAPDGSAVAVQDYSQSWDPAVYDTGDIYIIHNLANILAAPKKPGTQVSTLAPTSFSDPNVAAIRTTETENVAVDPSFSADKSLVFYNEDVNHKFQYTWFLAILSDCDFDIMISRSDGVGEDIRLARSGNQMYLSATPGGTRLLYASDVGGFPHIFATSLIIKTEIAGDPVGDPADNDIITTAPQEVSDASGTVIEVPEATLVNFPADVPQVFTINTQIDPITQPQLPFAVEGIPVVREFGPAGTTFDRPVTVTITYSDEEVRGFDESHLRVFLYNETNGIYDREVTTITNRDLGNNTISFTVDHFSRFGLGGSSQTAPLRSLPVALVLLFAAYGYCLRRAH